MPIASVVGPQPSWDLLADYQLLTQYPFMRQAFVAGTLVAILAGVVGYFMVIRGQSFAGHSLANVGFAGATGAALVGISPILGLFMAGVLAAAGIQVLGLGARQTRQNDVAVGAIFTAALALGFLFLHLTKSEYGGSIYTVLFGNPLGISARDVRLIVVASVVFGLVLLG
nr:metal ABC transporter permease [Ktedonobacterales bacterium]